MSAASEPILPKPTTKNTGFGRTNRWEQQVHFNALFGRNNCSKIVQEEISSLQNSRKKPKNKAEI